MSPIAVALALTLAAAPAGAAQPAAQPRPGRGAPDVSSFPPDQRSRWPLVVQKCSRCHSMEVSLAHGYSPAEWKASMRRMVRLPGAAISQQQAGEILEFLRWYSASAPRR